MGNIIVRFFDKSNKPNRITLPSTKNAITERMHGNSFEEKDFDIYNVEMLGVEFESFVDDKDIVGFNLLAEKLEMLKREELHTFQAVLKSKNVLISEKLKTVDALELCKIIDNLNCYKLHKDSENLKDEQLVNCEKIEYLGVLERVGEYENIDNSEVYRNYELPEDQPVMEISIREFIGVGDYGEEVNVLEFPLRDIVKKDFDIVSGLDENKHFKVSNSCGYKLDVYMDYLVTKQDLFDLNEFAKEFIKLDEYTQKQFVALHDMYFEVHEEEFENGIPINQLNQVLKDIDKFQFFGNDELKELIVNAHLTAKGVDRELRKYMDYDKLFEEVICETDFYKENVYDQKFNMNFVDKNVYDEYLKDEHETLIQETQVNNLEIEMKFN